MKKLIILTTILFSFNLLADDEICEQATGDQLDQLAEQNCDVVNKASTCAQVTPDPDGLRKLITNRLERSYTDQENFKKLWSTYKGTAWNQMFDYNQFNSKEVPKHLLDWFTNDGKATVSKEDVKQSIIEEYVKFSQKNDCNPIIKHQNTSRKYPPQDFDKEEDLKKAMRAPNYQEEKDKFFRDLNSRALERGTYCESEYADTRPFHYVAQKFPPCSGSVSGLYKDNVWSSSSLDSNLASQATSELSACIKDAVSRGAKIHHISVVSSASALNNTGPAAKKFCKKGFLQLSQARAEAARDKILPQLFSSSGMNPETYQSKIILNYDGSNGDGTSGPCPYVLKNGVETLKPEFKTTEGKKALDDAKYVNLQVTFEAQTQAVSDNKKHYGASYACRNIRFECAPIQASAK